MNNMIYDSPNSCACMSKILLIWTVKSAQKGTKITVKYAQNGTKITVKSALNGTKVC